MKYHVTGTVTGSKYLSCFEANSEEEAIEKALESDAGNFVSLCNQCSGECEDAQITEATASVEEANDPQ